jgi:hypothetical protein
MQKPIEGVVTGAQCAEREGRGINDNINDASKILFILVYIDCICRPEGQRDQREFQSGFDFFDLSDSTNVIRHLDRKKRLRYPHTPNEAAMDCKRRREEPCII